MLRYRLLVKTYAILRRSDICIRKMMLSLKASEWERIHHLLQTPPHLYTQNNAFAEDFCAEAYTSTPPRYLYTQNVAFAKGFFIKAYTLPLADAPISVYAK